MRSGRSPTSGPGTDREATSTSTWRSSSSSRTHIPTCRSAPDLSWRDQDGRRRGWRPAPELRPQVVHHARRVVLSVHPGRTVPDRSTTSSRSTCPHNFRPPSGNYIRLMVAWRAAPGHRHRAEPVHPGAGRRTAGVALPGRGRPAGSAAPSQEHLRAFLLLPMLAATDCPYPAITYPHKRHDACFAGSRPDTPTASGLTGAAAPESGADPIRQPDPTAGSCAPVGFPRLQLESLFAAAALVAVPPTTRGSGLPVLGGRWCAACRWSPAAAGSLPEVARPEDLVPAEDVAAWAAAIEAVRRVDRRPERSSPGSGQTAGVGGRPAHGLHRAAAARPSPDVEAAPPRSCANIPSLCLPSRPRRRPRRGEKDDRHRRGPPRRGAPSAHVVTALPVLPRHDRGRRPAAAPSSTPWG